MRSHGSLLLYALCAVLYLASGAAQAQTASAEVRSAIQALREAPPFARASERKAVVDLGDVAIDPLIEAVKARDTNEDVYFTANCIIALGELKAQKATDTLIEVLGEGNLPLAYWAAANLGRIWKGKGGQDPKVKSVNSALLAMLYSDLPEVAAYGPAVALAGVNTMGIERPRSRSGGELKSVIGNWFTRNPDALPPAAQRPWQLNVYVALNSKDAAARQVAIQALTQQRKLGCVDAIVDALVADADEQPPEASALASLVGELTRVPFPPPGMPADASPQEQVRQWRWLWLRRLADQTDARSIQYAWRGLETSLARYQADPSDETAEPVKFFRSALLSQLSGPDAIAAAVSPKARDLLKESLEIKEKIANALNAVASATTPVEKGIYLDVIKDQTKTKRGVEVAAQFLDRLYGLAYDEVNAKVAKKIGYIMAKVSPIPCDLGRSEIGARRTRLKEWRKEAERLGLVG